MTTYSCIHSESVIVYSMISHACSSQLHPASTCVQIYSYTKTCESIDDYIWTNWIQHTKHIASRYCPHTNSYINTFIFLVNTLEPIHSYQPIYSHEPSDSYEPNHSYEPIGSYEPIDSYKPIDWYEPIDSYKPSVSRQCLHTDIFIYIITCLHICT